MSGMPLDIHLKPVEALLFRSDVMAVGKFRCPASHPLYRDSGPCSHHTFVFPRTMTFIRHSGGASFLGDPSAVAFYNQFQEYTRRPVSAVDASDWYTVADDVLLDLVSEHDPKATPRRPFRLSHAPVDARSFLEQRRIFDALAAGLPVDPMHVEETMLRVLQRVLARASGRPSRSDTVQRDAEAVEHVKTLVAASPARSVPLRTLAQATGLSPFQLCRAFRARTGETITRYRHSLRLRLALHRLRDGAPDLTDLALDLGYSSHSHFTFVFRQHFGVTPSEYRGRATELLPV